MRRSPISLATLALIVLLAGSLLTACGGDADTKDAADGTGQADGQVAPLTETDPNPDCDPLQPSWCALPWPSNRYLTADKTTETGVRLNLGAKTLPANTQGIHISPAKLNRFDGYGVSSGLLVHFPDLDISAMGKENDLDPSLAKDAQVVLLEVDKSGGVTRVPTWVEFDLTSFNPDNTVLFVRPAVILKEATRYVVGFRNLKTTKGDTVAASQAFAALRDGKTEGTFLASRQARFDEVFALLKKDGFARETSVLAWDFVTASSSTIHGDMLKMRDAELKAQPLGAELTITKVESFTKKQDPDTALLFTGEMTIPSYMESFTVGAAMPEGTFNPPQKSERMARTADGAPKKTGTRKATFWVTVPHSAMDGSPHGIVQYGHGLLGKGSQVRGRFNRKIGNDYKLIHFACDWTGMADEDYKPIAQMIFEFSDFYMLPERLHQGLLESLLLGRAMRERFAGLDHVKNAVDKTTGKTVAIQIDKKRFFYSGISQGGIYGATYMALSTDVVRGHLGVPGQNYSLLLHRSVDFTPFFVVMMAAYTESIDRAILLMSGQTLWDQIDPVSYYRHIKAEPFKGTPSHDVLLASAKGDWQVALLTNEITARSDIGIKLMANYGKDVSLIKTTAYPHKGSGVVNYDIGNPWAKPGNKPDETTVPGLLCGEKGQCWGKAHCKSGSTAKACTLKDPHGRIRYLDHHNAQLIHFFDTGEIKDVCGGDACTPL
ncbi:MAG: hypothetical protein KC502_18035 [Myxococcales bacterium]|nr:hypothetical protein [Myxococcales bacterium]